jgi:hypothetical protein
MSLERANLFNADRRCEVAICEATLPALSSEKYAERMIPAHLEGHSVTLTSIVSGGWG